MDMDALRGPWPALYLVVKAIEDQEPEPAEEDEPVAEAA